MLGPINLRDYLRSRAAWVWNEQKRAFKYELTLQEETLTELLLLRMAHDLGKHGLSVRMFTRAEENETGADWEWIIRTLDCSVALRVQAKRLYHKTKGGDYGGLDPKADQSDKLISNAAGAVPLYVFYNHALGNDPNKFDTGKDSPYRGPSYWGCSVARAELVKAKKSRKVTDLRPVMSPWHRLFDHSGGCSLLFELGISARELSSSIDATRKDVMGALWPLGQGEFLNSSFLSKYLLERELAGVAFSELYDFRGG